ncbi:hypothetical protein TELCIR_07878, partial [Teladorsagia circumcincta]
GDLGQCTIIFRAAVYLIALFYMFFGVSIVADRFMAAIEVITSQEREVKMKKITGEPYTILIRVWNETVSNLTLMALGESMHVWEGVLTFVFFPLTVLSAYVADTYTGIFGQRLLDTTVRTFFARRRSSRRSPSKEKTSAIENGKDDHRMSLIHTTTDADAIAFEEHRKHAQHPDAPVAELEKLATERVVSRQKKSRAFYRIQATRQLVGQGDITKKKLKKKAEELIEPLIKKAEVPVVECVAEESQA